MKALNWIRVLIYTCVLALAAHAPMRVSMARSLLGKGAMFGDGPWKDPAGVSLVLVLLLTFFIACFQSSKWRELLASSVLVSFTMFPFTLAYLFGGVMGIAMATPCVFVGSRLVLGLKYYLPSQPKESNKTHEGIGEELAKPSE